MSDETKAKKRPIEETATEEAAAPAAKKRRTIDINYKPPLLIPIAAPLADDKLTKRVYKLVTKSTKDKKIRRGVKEVVKAIRKEKAPESKKRLCVIAGDITPIDVITHIPVMCEEHSIPYVYIRSRAVLGQAAKTKRPTSVVLVNLPAGSEHEGLYDKCVKKIKGLTAETAAESK